jgi:hypothetical protein
MTAGSGLLHIETRPEQLVESGGLFHGFQLWVNLPAKFVALTWRRTRRRLAVVRSSWGPLCAATDTALDTRQMRICARSTHQNVHFGCERWPSALIHRGPGRKDRHGAS